MKVELLGGRSPMEPNGWRDEAELEEWSTVELTGRRLTKAKPEG